MLLVTSTSLPPVPSHLAPDIEALHHTSEATPEIDRWRSGIPSRAKDDNHSRYAESIDGGPASEASSRATSRLPVITRQCDTQHMHPNKGYTGRIRSPRLPPAQGCSYTRGPLSTSSQTSLTGRTTTSSATCLCPYFPTEPTLAHKSGVCPFTLYSCVTNFESLTFTSHPSDPITYHVDPFQSRVARPPGSSTESLQLWPGSRPNSQVWVDL
ncbi:hypothetical protein EDB83DRAFT_1095836 [Lactarius deliciosus]|nr:hypothetical protein EDB83DRAFT_1095836 [Lactarius deliciosus]